MMAPPPKSNPPSPHRAALGARLSWLREDSARRILALVILSLGVALLVVDHVQTPTRVYQEGDVAEHDVRAPASFPFTDWEQSLEREQQAGASVLLVFDHDADLSRRLQGRVSRAFHGARNRLNELRTVAMVEERELTGPELDMVSEGFVADLELSLSAEDLQRLRDARWSDEIEQHANGLVALGMQHYIIADRSTLPMDEQPLSVIRLLESGRDELQLDDREQIKTPAEARQIISLHVLEQESSSEAGPAARAALAVARAAVRPNFSYNRLITEERRRDRRAQTPAVIVDVKQGMAIVREGDVVTRQQAEMLEYLASRQDGYGMFGVLMAMIACCAMVFTTLYSFGAGFIQRFSTRAQDVEATAFLTLLTALIARMVIEASEPLSAAIGWGITPDALWYAVPFAGGAMLVRILINAETALLWILGTSVVLGMMMEQHVLYVLFFAISGVTAAASISSTRERLQVLRAGVQTGLINAAIALLISLVQVHLGDTLPAAGPAAGAPLWDVAGAFLGGIGSAFLVLGLVPVFEQFNFVTDFKLLELANLNHPLLRQLMLRAPGTYHHSMTVASLSEAAAEAIGAHALQTRVACYFHDIGKALQPQFFIENQRGGPNPHDRLKPHQSARVIVNHVVDGAAIAEQHNLPQCIMDGILMHHGTSLIKYFYVKAVEQAKDGQEIDENDFRYPGTRPNTREAGIIFLADRVEAACRTIKVPTAHNFRSMIQKLVNDAITDGQLEECPLTVKELYTIVEVFTSTLQGIHHHRIEYPLLPHSDAKKKAAPQDQGESPSPIITLEMANPLAEKQAEKADAEQSQEN
ncbi:MAG: HDIG domain-containing metalloprotein [Myxococcota bacterium]